MQLIKQKQKRITMGNVRQQKQQFLVELQPSNQADEELQLQIALELSKKQAEIDAQQRLGISTAILLRGRQIESC